jgi:hypothetical protein
MWAAASIWLTIGPALIAGGIGVFSAVLSFAMANRSVEAARDEAHETRLAQRDLLVWQHRLSAVETVWLLAFEIERTMAITSQARDTLVRSVVWLPDPARSHTLALVVGLQDDSQHDLSNRLEKLRDSLLQLGTTAASPLITEV